jgi:hypothetical protein
MLETISCWNTVVRTNKHYCTNTRQNFCRDRANSEVLDWKTQCHCAIDRNVCSSAVYESPNLEKERRIRGWEFIIYESRRPPVYRNWWINFTHKKYIHRIQGVRIYVFSLCYFKFCLFIFKDNRTLWQNAENYGADVSALFWINDTLALGICKWCLFTVLVLYID